MGQIWAGWNQSKRKKNRNERCLSQEQFKRIAKLDSGRQYKKLVHQLKVVIKAHQFNRSNKDKMTWQKAKDRSKGPSKAIHLETEEHG